MTELEMIARSLGLQLSRESSYSTSATISTADGAEIYGADSEECLRAFLLGWMACLSRSKP
ncbi:MAG TPA: hypothetical protein VMR29_10775 [Candidatus Binatia bacterium]|nr:hypothetical protein [Candidatus Binatia bacterium]